jgi:hypothetical protein
MEIDDCASISRQQNPPRPAHSRTLESFPFGLSLSLFARRSLLSLPLSAVTSSDREDTERASGRWSDHGAVAGPLAGARAPQRVSTPPSSGLAVAFSPLAEPGEKSSRLGLLLPRRRKAGSAPFSLLPRPLLTFGINPWWGWGQDLGLGLRFSIRFDSADSFFCSFDFFLSFVHPKRGSRVRVSALFILMPKHILFPLISFLFGFDSD